MSTPAPRATIERTSPPLQCRPAIVANAPDSVLSCRLHGFPVDIAAGIADRIAEQLGVRLLLLMRLLPLFDFNVVSYAAGLTDMSLGRYVVGTVAGIALPVLGFGSRSSRLGQS